MVEMIMTRTIKSPLHKALLMPNTQNPFRQSSHSADEFHDNNSLQSLMSSSTE